MAQVSSTVSDSGQPVERRDRVSIVEAGLDGVGECESVPTRGVTLIGEGRFVSPDSRFVLEEERSVRPRNLPSPPRKLGAPQAFAPQHLYD